MSGGKGSTSQTLLGNIAHEASAKIFVSERYDIVIRFMARWKRKGFAALSKIVSLTHSSAKMLGKFGYKWQQFCKMFAIFMKIRNKVLQVYLLCSLQVKTRV